MPPTIEVWIDRGGTFTDCLASDSSTGEVLVTKVLSGDDAPARGIRALFALPPDAPLPECTIRMGTTLATNALLERKGTPVGLLVSRGLGDLLRIDDQSRSDLFDLRAPRATPLTEHVAELGARVAVDGEVLAPVDPEEVRQALRGFRVAGVRAVVVAFLHAHRFPEHEREVAALATEQGFFVVCSHEVSAEAGLLARAQTALVDAYLTPTLQENLGRLRAEVGAGELSLMTSGAQLVPSHLLRGRDAVLSGPAGGAVACRRIAEQAEEREVLGFDMGGTSTDVCRVADGAYERRREALVAGVRVRAPMVAVHTVAAGGGSLCRFEGRRLTVGPESAGAVPGPLAYGHADAEEPTLTDVALVLGRIRSDRFPISLDEARARAGLGRLAEAAGLDPMACAEGLFAIAVEHMAAAIASISTARGHDPRTHALVVFGGAAGQWAGAVARRLGIRRLLVHPFAGVLSAFGIGIAPEGWYGEAATLGPLDEEHCEVLRREAARLEAEGTRALAAGGLEAPTSRDASDDVGEAPREASSSVALRYAGSETGLDVPLTASSTAASLAEAFEQAHRRRFGYVRVGRAIEAVRVRSRVEGPVHEGPVREGPVHEGPVHEGGRAVSGRPSGLPRGRGVLWIAGVEREVDLWWREDLPIETPLPGPFVVLEATGTLVVDEGFVLVRRDDDLIVVDDVSEVAESALPSDGDSEKEPDRSSRGALSDGARRTLGEANAVDPILLEVFAHAFTSIAERMGGVLQRTALSTNVRDRLDFSCAVFDAEGSLVANAPHIPVHLGAMGAAVRAIASTFGADMRVGDVFATNDPSAGGSHLPDITVVAPVHDEAGVVRAFVAARGHHADVGGITPGSMPPTSKCLEEEGVLLRALPIVRGGELLVDDVRAAFGAGPWPARRIDENLADLEAQIASCRTGASLFLALRARHGGGRVERYMGFLQEAAAHAVAEAVSRLPHETHVFSDALDDGSPIVVRITHRPSAPLEIDFTGTSGAHPGNLNAPRAVTVACVLYVLRAWVGRALPLNEGCLRAVSIVIPEGSLLDPPAGRAVAGGNVETSQRVVDVLLGAFAGFGAPVPAASQGTMNNLTFGDGSFGYYETLGGGAGAGADHDGTSAVHTHMTNSRITDAEILETRAPVRVRSFSIRRGSGGAGRHRGGDGLVRELEATRPLDVALLAQRRTRAPSGLFGGAPGACGVDTIVRADGRREPLREVAHLDVGDAVRIETPGGGGYGNVGNDSRGGGDGGDGERES